MKNPYELAKNILQSTTGEIMPVSIPGGFTSIDLYGASIREKERSRKLIKPDFIAYDHRHKNNISRLLCRY